MCISVYYYDASPNGRRCAQRKICANDTVKHFMSVFATNKHSTVIYLIPTERIRIYRGSRKCGKCARSPLIIYHCNANANEREKERALLEKRQRRMGQAHDKTHWRRLSRFFLMEFVVVKSWLIRNSTELLLSLRSWMAEVAYKLFACHR